MKKVFYLFALIFFAMSQITFAQRKTVELTFLHTSDVHGSIFTYNYMKHKSTQSGLPVIFSYADSLRNALGERLIMTDGGDCLQGQPTAYYSNFVDTIHPHLIASAMNQMGYVCSVIGNHDIETGHTVYDRWIRELDMPVLGANVIDTRIDKPYLTPYICFTREGVKIAILGMCTAGIPFWLPEKFWSNLRFDDITESSRYWVKYILDNEHPDLIVGLFHSGFNGGILQDGIRENATEYTAQQVPGFDFILYGHDHRAVVHEVQNVEGNTVKCMGPTNDGVRFVLANVKLTFLDGKVIKKEINGSVPFATDCQASIAESSSYTTDNVMAQLFEAEFVNERIELNEWVNRTVGKLSIGLDEKDAYFGPSLFIDFIHQLQLEISGADISFAAPLSYDSYIKAGPLTVNDMFNIYKFENYLYCMRLTGREVKNYLEMSYDQWINQMSSPDDHLFKLKQAVIDSGRSTFVNYTYNFDSAAGILYVVDVSKPMGERIIIKGMADGTPFDLNKDYKVALNSYRGNGGGELLTKGAGIPRKDLSSRLLDATASDLRYIMMQHISKAGIVEPKLLNHWHFIPEDWVKNAAERDRILLFK